MREIWYKALFVTFLYPAITDKVADCTGKIPPFRIEKLLQIFLTVKLPDLNKQAIPYFSFSPFAPPPTPK